MQIVHYIHFNTPFPVWGYGHGGGGQRAAYWLGKAQAELGHKVIYICKKVSKISIPFARTIEAPKNFDDLTPLIPAKTDIVQVYYTPIFKLDYPFLIRIGGNGRVGDKYHENTVFISASNAANHNWTEYVHNGLDISDYPLITRKKNFLLFLSKADWIVKNLLGAIRIANKANIPLQVGGGRAPFWSRGVISHGIVDGKEKLELLQNSLALLFPIVWDEPFGNVAIEALACGTPVIATPRGALPEIIDSSCGILANSFDELVEATSKVKNFDPEACRNRIIQKFTHIHMAEKYLSYYSKILRDGFLKEGHPVALGNPRKLIYYEQPIHHLLLNSISAFYPKWE